MKQFIRVMKALSDPGRVKILKMLQTKEMCVCEIQAVLGLAQPTISKHLKLLEDAYLVESHKEKVWVNYRLATGQDSKYAESMLKNLEAWLNDSPEVQDAVIRSSSVNRENIKLEK